MPHASLRACNSRCPVTCARLKKPKSTRGLMVICSSGTATSARKWRPVRSSRRLIRPSWIRSCCRASRKSARHSPERSRRHVDTGALIRAGGNASALFDLAQTDTLRVQVNVPQAYLRDIAIGSTVAIAVAEYPGRAFPGKVLRTSGAFDATTRTMLTEIEVPNRNGELFPGI